MIGNDRLAESLTLLLARDEPPDFTADARTAAQELLRDIKAEEAEAA